MSKSKFLTLAVAALFLLNTATLAFLFFKKPPPPPLQREGPKEVVIERLHFDARQVAGYEKLIAQHRQAIESVQQEMGNARKALFEQLQGDDFSQKDSLLSVIGQLQQQIEDAHFQHFAEVKKLCKPDQAPAFDALTSELARFLAPPPLPGRGAHPPRSK